MKSIFRLYNNLGASYFDLIEGDKETQQTKGLALILAKSEIARKAFFDIDKVEAKVGRIDWGSISQVIVNAELISNGLSKQRADVVIRLYSNNRPIKLIIIEAKSLNKNTSVKFAVKQLQGYIKSKTFREFDDFRDEDIYGITLTKYPGYLDQENFISITWSDIVNKYYHLYKINDRLLSDYFDFITNIRGGMKFYEREVFSIPTVKWSNEAINKFFVYECPNSGSYLIKKKPLYLTFRKSGGGEMSKLYKIDEVLILNFSEELNAFIEDENYSVDVRKRVLEYVEYMKRKGIWSESMPRDEKQVFLLSDRTIDLPHRPRPRKNNSFRAYYRLADLLDKDLEYVETS